jgi:hypothetical protein
MKSKYDAILVQMVGYDTNCDGKVDQLDTNGDGVIDSMILPIPTSQIPQGRMAKVCQSMPIKLSAAVMISATGYDTNGDGAIDSLDTNADGRIDSRIVPQAASGEEAAAGRGKAAPMPVQKQQRDKDGTLIAVGYDTNMDGKVDCLDTNGDGNIDAKIVRIDEDGESAGEHGVLLRELTFRTPQVKLVGLTEECESALLRKKQESGSG